MVDFCGKLVGKYTIHGSCGLERKTAGIASQFLFFTTKVSLRLCWDNPSSLVSFQAPASNTPKRPRFWNPWKPSQLGHSKKHIMTEARQNILFSGFGFSGVFSPLVIESNMAIGKPTFWIGNTSSNVDEMSSKQKSWTAPEASGCLKILKHKKTSQKGKKKKRNKDPKGKEEFHLGSTPAVTITFLRSFFPLGWS